MTTRRRLGGLVTALACLASASAWAQAPGYPAPSSSSPYAMPPSSMAPSTMAPPSLPPAGTYPPATPGLMPGPAAPLDSNMQLPPPQWDPYASPGTQSPTLLQQDPYFSTPSPDSFYGRVAQAQRFLQEIRFEYTFLPGNGPSQFGINVGELTATFAIPFLYNRQTPLLITPGFAENNWSGPKSPGQDLPANAFDAYLDTAWNPQIRPWLGAELGARVGVYSDYQKVTSESIRVMGQGLAVLGMTPSFKLKFGVMYLDRIPVKLLPAGGIVWTPNSDTVFEILFPNPRIARRFINVGNSEWWLYARGEYGGGAWTVKRESTSFEKIGYNDIRFAGGIDFQRHNGLRGFVEAGVAFDREIVFRTSPTFRPTTTALLSAGLIY